MASGVDLREAWTATTRLDELASSRDAKMEELEYAHARAVGNLSSAKEHLAQAARRLATERAAANRTSATYRGGSPYRSPSRNPATIAVEAVMDDALHSAKAALAAAGGDFRSVATKKHSPRHRSVWGPSSAEAVRGRVGSRVRAAEAAAQGAAHRARQSRRQSQTERMAAQQPLQQLEEWLEVRPATSPDEELTLSSSTATSMSNRRASEEPQGLHEDLSRPGQAVRPASQSIVSSGAGSAVGMILRPRSSSPPSNSRSARSRTRLSEKSAAAGSDVSSAVVWGSVTRHMTAVHTHRRRVAAAAVRKCPPAARKLLAAALYRCPAVHPPTRPRSPNQHDAHSRKKNGSLERQFAHARHGTHPHEGRRISRSEFRAACAAVMPRHSALAHNLSTATIDTLTEW